MEEISLPLDLHGVKIHFVGIKGTGMAALVEILASRGAEISGSDVSERFYTDEILENLNIKVKAFSEENLNPDIKLVIYSSAYSVQKNPDLKKALELEIPTIQYAQALGLLSEASYSVGICGVHGKTTTTGFTGTLLKELPLESSALAGSIISSFGNSCTMSKGHKYFVAETCEYQKNFMNFYPKKIVLTSVESDHQDFYPTYEDIRNAFVDYAKKLPQNEDLIFCADDKGATETAEIVKNIRPDINFIPYGCNALGDFKIEFGRIENGRQYFKIASLGEFYICVPGIHNIRNATAALAVVVRLLQNDKKNPEDYIENLKKGLAEFSGGKRRSEILGHRKNKFGQDIIFIDDYGHHPTAIKSTLSGYREFYKNHKIIVDFMSHTYSRTQALLKEFASCFTDADEIIINKIYASAREDSSSAKVNGKILAEETKKYNKNVTYAKEFSDAANFALEMLNQDCSQTYPDGYLFVTMGAGDNWKVGKLVMEKI